MKKFKIVTEVRLLTDSGIDDHIGDVKLDEFDQIPAAELARVISRAGVTFAEGDKIEIRTVEREVAM